LVAKDYLVRTRSQADGCSARLDLTDKAKAILADDPFEALVRAAGALPPSARGRLANALERLLGHVARERCKRPFGSCTSCEHLRGADSCREGKPPYQCGFVDEALAEAELEELCINFEPGRNSAMKRTYAEERPQ
jgi:DNA-binding MarR family transcriptional regulator